MQPVAFGAAVRALWGRIDRLDPGDVEGHLAAIREFCALAGEEWPPAALVGAVLDAQLAALGRLERDRWRVRATVEACYRVAA